MTEPRRRLLESAIARLRRLAAQERSRTGAQGRDNYSSTALRNAEAHEKQATALQAELDGSEA